MEELLSNDENQWVNVQDPVKQMITGITKSVKVQAVGMRDLDKRMSKCITKDNAEQLIAETFSNSFLQQVSLKSGYLRLRYHNTTIVFHSHK
jgi:hypothetical protein